uniref:Uncharacterized protein n=1 Tax=Aegilops tauschii TaxID=37682 RepID=R7WA08_AEGTA
MNGLYVDKGKKAADARRGRNGTRAMENRAKPRTRHTHVHGPVNGRLNYYRDIVISRMCRPSQTPHLTMSSARIGPRLFTLETARERYSVLRIFMGHRGRTGHRVMCGALPATGPYLRLNRFQDWQAIKQKR